MSVRTVPTEWLLCIMQRKHAMTGFTPGPGEYDGPSWGRTFSLRCVQCGTTRYVTIDSLGEISTQRYVRPKGYTEARAEALVRSTADVRLEYVRRMRIETRERSENGRRRRAS